MTLLKDKVVRLVPFFKDEDYKYLHTLIAKYDPVVPKDRYHRIKDLARYLWTGFTSDDIKGGVIYLSYFEGWNWWVLNAYRDDKFLAILEDREDWSFHAAELVIKFFFKNVNDDRLYTLTDVKRVHSLKMLDRLGFKKIGAFSNQLGDFNLFVKTKD